jgi:uncharacterized protein YukE
VAVATVTVVPDPTLMAADPGAMASAARQFIAAAHQLYEVFQTSTTAQNVLYNGWHGQGADGFNTAAQQINENAQTGAQSLIGSGNALNVLSAAITGAQAKARQAMALATHTNQAATSLSSAYVSSSQQAVAALPANAPPDVVKAAMQPTPGQSSQAGQLAADGVQAQRLMNEANSEARQAWSQAQVAFDAVTAQSPSVQLALLGARVKAFSKSMDSVAMTTLAIAISGSLSGEVPGGDDEGDEDEVIPTEEGHSLNSELATEELAAGDNIKVDGTGLDKEVALIGNGDGVVKAEEAEQAALGNPGGGREIQDPAASLEATGPLAFLKPVASSDVVSEGAAPGDTPELLPTIGEAPPGWSAPPPNELNNFSGPVEPTVMEPGVTYYRVVGEGNAPNGSWWTATPPTPDDRAGLAIKPSWNSMTGVVEFTPASSLPPGTEAGIPAWHGAAAPKSVILPDGKPGYLPGGADQIWVPRGALSNDNGTFTIRPMPGGG